MTLQGIASWCRIMSLDVVLGTVAGGAAAQTYFGAKLPTSWLFVLALSVWAIYSADHLLDARRIGHAAHSKRHLYHWIHFKFIAVLAVIAAVAAILMTVFSLGGTVVWFGIAMGALTSLHLILVKLVGNVSKPWLVKEFGVALIYTVGIWGLPLYVSGRWLDLGSWIPVMQFFLIGMLNLLVFSIYERDTDALDGQSSIVQALGEENSRRLAWASGLVVGGFMLLHAMLMGTQEWLLQLIVMLMAGLQLWLLAAPGIFARNEYYRLAGDAAFSLPFIYVCFKAWC